MVRVRSHKPRTRNKRYLTTKRPCIQGWMTQMKYSVVPGLAVTLKLTWLWPRPFGPTSIESPGVSKPGRPTFTRRIGGGPDGGGPFGFTPCDWRIGPQIAQLSTCPTVRGTSDLLTIESECASLVVL